MLRLFGKASSDCYGFYNRKIAPQIVFAGLGYFARCNEIWLVEVSERDCDHGIVQDLGVGDLHRFREFGYRLPFYKDRANPSQGHVTVRLNGYRLVEFRRILEIQIKRVALAQTITRMSLMKLCVLIVLGTPVAR